MTSLVSTLVNRSAAEDLNLVDLDAEGYEFEDNTIICTMHHFDYAFKRLRLGLEQRYAFKNALSVYMKPFVFYRDPSFWGELTLG